MAEPEVKMDEIDQPLDEIKTIFAGVTGSALSSVTVSELMEKIQRIADAGKTAMRQNEKFKQELQELKEVSWAAKGKAEELTEKHTASLRELGKQKMITGNLKQELVTAKGQIGELTNKLAILQSDRNRLVSVVSHLISAINLLQPS